MSRMKISTEQKNKQQKSRDYWRAHGRKCCRRFFVGFDGGLCVCIVCGFDGGTEGGPPSCTHTHKQPEHQTTDHNLLRIVNSK